MKTKIKENIFSAILVGLLIAFMITLTACAPDTPVVPTTTTPTTTTPSTTGGEIILGGTSEMKTFNNIDELKTFLEAVQTTSITQNYYRGGIMMESALSSKSVSDSMAPVATGAGDYSQTNTQYQSVDEADFIKNDGKYIYMIANNNLVIIDAADGTNSEIVSTTNLGTDKYYGNVANIFLNKDTIVVIKNTYEPTFYFNEYDIMPQESSKSITQVMLYDVSNREKPIVKSTYTISGNYYESRMIDNNLYFITQEYLNDWRYYGGPLVKYANTEIMPTIHYFDNPEDSYVMNTITSINIEEERVVDTESFMLGYDTTVMVSEDNIYIAYQKNQWRCFGWRCMNTYDGDARDRFTTVVVPLLQGDIKTRVDSILKLKLEKTEEWSRISKELNTFFTEIKKDEALQSQYEDMFTNIEDALNTYDEKKALENSKTIIHKIAINNGKLNYETKGEVDGRLLNQFSMDENNGNLRVATSINIWLSKGSIRNNNVYILDDNLKILGSLKGLAENESIYSTRFVGDKLYMVTFRQIDPFFVIDLSNVQKPKVLGYLKIPGYSSYLHPISDTLILGVGQDTTVNEWGGTSTAGVKISLFDVSDFNHPVEVDKYIIGEQGSYTPIQNDHKAFLYSESKGIVVIPVSEVASRVKSGQYDYRTTMWYGAYVLDVSKDGLSLAGKVKHSGAETSYYDWYNQANVQRSLYIGDTLYTISDKYVKANDLSNDLKSLNTIDLPAQNYNYPIPIDTVSSGSSGSEGVIVN